MIGGLPVLGAIAASWGLFKDIVSFFKDVHDARTQIPDILLRFENDECLMSALAGFFTIEVLRSLNDDDLQHLTRVMAFVLPKLQDVAVRLRKYGKKTIWDQAKWGVVSKGLKSSEEDIYQWIHRLRYCLMLLPGAVKQDLIDSFSRRSEQAPNTIVALRAQQAIQQRVDQFQLVELTADDPRVAEARLVDAATDGIRPSQNLQIVPILSRPYLVEFKRIQAQAAYDTQSIDRLEMEAAKLVHVFADLPESETHLLQPNKYFRSTQVATAPFGIIYKIPSQLSNPYTLAQLLSETNANGSRRLNHSLDQRFKLLHQIATAVLFVHSTGWVHKGVCGANVLVVATNADELPSQNRLHELGNAFLAGFDFTRQQASSSTGDEMAGQGWERQVYQHPSREKEEGTEVKPFTQEHDIYAFGVLLVELGRWKSVGLYPHLFKDATAVERKKALEALTRTLPVTLGQRFTDLAVKCLGVLDVTEAGHSQGWSEPKMRDVCQILDELATVLK